jgi:type IV pilus assembly protein PilK
MMAQSYLPLPALSDRQFAEWQQLIEARTGIDLSQYRSILQSGLSRRLRSVGAIEYDRYFALIQQQPEGVAEWQALVACIAIKETSFFRQPAAFELVRDYLRKRVVGAASVDLWSVGCATGEEAFGLAMAANDAIEGQQARCCYGVMGTDLCVEALQQARSGRFPTKRLDRVPEGMRRRYFDADGERAQQAVASLRERVCFLQANLLEIERLPVLPMDVIFCQNVLVYFRRWRTKQILDALVERLKPGGLLVLGPGEAAQWQHPALLRTAHAGVSAWLRRTESVATPH